MNRDNFNDLTPEERHYDRLRHFPKILDRWRGGRARIWNYTISHSVLTVRIEQNEISGHLIIGCAGLIHVNSPERWEDCDLKITLVENDSGDLDYLVRDSKAGVEIRCELAEISESIETRQQPP